MVKNSVLVATLSILIVVFVVFGGAGITGFFTAESEETHNNLDAFSQCLYEKGVTLYCTDGSDACRVQRGMFGDSFMYLSYRDCSKNGLCSGQEITIYPTWVIRGSKYTGIRSLEDLSHLTGCSLIS